MADTSTLGLRCCGVWTRAEALAVLGRGQVDALVRSRTWQVAWRGVYADAGHELDAEQRAWAAVLAAGGAAGPRLRAVAVGRTAARVWGWFELRREQSALVRRISEVHAGLAVARRSA